MLIVTTTKGETSQPRGHPSRRTVRQCKEVWRTCDLWDCCTGLWGWQSRPASTHAGARQPAEAYGVEVSAPLDCWYGHAPVPPSPSNPRGKRAMRLLNAILSVRDDPTFALGGKQGEACPRAATLAIADFCVRGSRWQMDILSEGRQGHWGAVSLDLRYCAESARVDVTDAGQR
jgi:hypothetical protein